MHIYQYVFMVNNTFWLVQGFTSSLENIMQDSSEKGNWVLAQIKFMFMKCIFFAVEKIVYFEVL